MTSHQRSAPYHSAGPTVGPTVGEVAKRTDAVLHPDYPLDEAFTRIRERASTFIPVADGVQIVGVFDVRSMARFRRKTTHDRRRLAVRDRMNTTIPFLYEDDPLTLAATIAARTGTTQFCVVDHRHRLTGTLSLSGKDAVAMPAAAAPAEPGQIERRFVSTASRAAESPPGDLGSYADTPTLRPPGTPRKNNLSG